MPDPRQSADSSRPSLRRWLLGAAGGLAVALAILGVFVPGLPTTPFLLLAGYCLRKSFPKTADRVLNAPIFRPYRRYLDGQAPIPRRAKITATVLMWGMITLSLGLLHGGGALNLFIGSLIVAAGLLGTYVLWRWIDRRRERAAAEAANAANATNPAMPAP